MPYSWPSNIPDMIKNIPVGAQKLFIASYNGASKDGATEDEARMAGWAGVKRKYKKQGDSWVRKFLSASIKGAVESIPDDVLELPGSVPIGWMKLYNALYTKTHNSEFSRIKCWSAIKKYVYQDNKGEWQLRKNVPKELAEHIGTGVTMQVLKKTDQKSIFKVLIPIEESSFTKESDGTIILKGVASGDWLDKHGDVMDAAFIEKMKKNAIGLPVYFDHKTDEDHYAGQVCSVIETDQPIFAPISKLEKAWSPENPAGNVLVAKMAERIAAGKKYCYSIGGSISKAVKFYDQTVKSNIRRILDGDLHELSIVQVGALPGSEVGLVSKGLFFTKNFNDANFCDINPNNFSEYEEYLDGDLGMALVKMADEVIDPFWMDFEKASDIFADLQSGQPKEVDLDKLPKSCFFKAYPFMYTDAGGANHVHFALFDKSFRQSQLDKDEGAIQFFTKLRDRLGIKERDYNEVDFNKILVSTLDEAIDAKKARERLYLLLDEYLYSVRDIALHWNPDYKPEDRASDIKGLSEQLASSLVELSEDISHEVVYAVKSQLYKKEVTNNER